MCPVLAVSTILVNASGLSQRQISGFTLGPGETGRPGPVVPFPRYWGDGSPLVETVSVHIAPETFTQQAHVTVITQMSTSGSSSWIDSVERIPKTGLIDKENGLLVLTISSEAKGGLSQRFDTVHTQRRITKDLNPGTPAAEGQCDLHLRLAKLPHWSSDTRHSQMLQRTTTVCIFDCISQCLEHRFIVLIRVNQGHITMRRKCHHSKLGLVRPVFQAFPPHHFRSLDRILAPRQVHETSFSSLPHYPDHASIAALVLRLSVLRSVTYGGQYADGS
ncbi:uncharacterized protein BO80DRAFT_430582 [Aspergillus ibericus CBS 121593]|uniref:Uncharacterized protein n=1 Tax=Aspergillus ibericus CBS 121593 TaxID=1448316 RepID=A0A395HE20_9EURO|nr:hypothetical protein BO80DRAFT_430582 [Aspergillus ibericus CBS 121593]RAL06211.1 hypothetical protein BO80DRAFT_430582 [Aspergillus ibericus CBS 121593]